jgi:hypothetical protein
VHGCAPCTAALGQGPAAVQGCSPALQWPAGKPEDSESRDNSFKEGPYSGTLWPKDGANRNSFPAPVLLRTPAGSAIAAAPGLPRYVESGNGLDPLLHPYSVWGWLWDTGLLQLLSGLL